LDTTPCSPLKSQLKFPRPSSGPACHLLSLWFLAWLIFRPWRCRRHVPPKHWLTFNSLHGDKSQKTEVYKILVWKPREERDHLKSFTGIGGRRTVEWSLKRVGREVLTEFIWFGYGAVARFCEHSNEPSASSGPKRWGTSCSSWAIISFSKWFPLHGVNRVVYFKLGLLGLRLKNHGHWVVSAVLQRRQAINISHFTEQEEPRQQLYECFLKAKCQIFNSNWVH
jgi:hypothetical protein